MIHFEGVSVRFGATQAVADVSLVAEAGKTTALIGPSGCGKSTLLRAAAGLVWPDEGSVEVAGAAVTEAAAEGIRRKIGYVLQEGGLFPHLTGRGNALLLPKHLGVGDEEATNKLNQLVDLTHLPTDALDRYPAELSGGQRQRLSLIRALMLDPEVLLLDEPLGALDPIVRASLQTDLKDVFAELGKTVLLVTHDMAEAGYLADKIVLMRKGSIVQEGSLEDLRDRPATAFVTDFVSAQRSLVEL